MASASSINTVSAAGNKNYISGLASGMDTDSIVESLLMGTQTKIDKQTGLKQQLEWKQETYRDLIGKINTFGDKYFSYYGSGQTNLMSPTTFKTMTGLSSNSAIKISSVSSNAVSSMKVDAVKQLATACTVKTAGTVTGAPVGKNADFSGFESSIGETKSFTVTLDGVSRTIDFVVEGTKGADDTTPGTVDVVKTVDNINEALYRNFGTSVGMAFKADPTESMKGTMELVQLNSNGDVADIPVNSSRRVIIETTGSSDSSNTIASLGFSGGFSNKLDYGTSLKNMNFATPLQGDRYEFEINGVTIKGLTGDSTLSDVISAINGSNAGVRVSYSSASDKFIMESSSTGQISNIKMSQKYGNLLTTMFGVKSTGFQSSLFSEDITSDAFTDMDSLLVDLNSGKDQSLVFQVDGKDVTIKLDGKTGSESYKDEKSVVDAINSKLNRDYGYGKIVFSLIEDDSNPDKKRAVLSSSEYKVGFSAENLDGGIAKKLGFNNPVDNVLVKTATWGSAGMSGSISVNGTEIYITEDTTLEKVAQRLKTAIGGSADVTYEDGRFNISGLTGNVKIEGTPGDDDKNPVEKMFGKKIVETIPNTLVANQVTGTDIFKGNLNITWVGADGATESSTLDASATDFDALADKIRNETQGTVDFSGGKLQLNGVDFTIEGADTDGKALLNKLFGGDRVSSQMTASVTSGQNAILTVDGTDIERNTNTFELDGITMEITSTYDASNGPISLTTSRDTDKIVDSLKSFVEDYNNLIEELNKQLTETANYKKYAPLTDAQKKEMSDKEIELWEEKSKQGLLHNDSNISSFLGDMRMVLYSSVEGAGLSLYDIGIETSDNWRDNGKLVIDEDALRSAVATNPDAIATLFTDRDQGLGVKMQNAIKAAANVSSGSPGSMVRYAGTKDVLTTSNTLYEEMKHITETLSNLNTKYQLEKTRYWKQFTAMEQAISNMNSQSSWLTQQFSS
uniref:flagellar filament capping protein FliD n=1 Tax=Enterocloster hominis (ex Hitch et al. 2024) TaxID=1917870 RepID=UPI0010308724|nr:flagellar filament capping protein FliD [Lachnoclostridium pacaense]